MTSKVSMQTKSGIGNTANHAYPSMRRDGLRAGRAPVPETVPRSTMTMSWLTYPMPIPRCVEAGVATGTTATIDV
jgi:hypothetical protein